MSNKPKLTYEQRLEILTLAYQSTLSKEKIGAKFDVSKQTIYDIINKAKKNKNYPPTLKIPAQSLEETTKQINQLDNINDSGDYVIIISDSIKTEMLEVLSPEYKYFTPSNVELKQINKIFNQGERKIAYYFRPSKIHSDN